VRARLRSCRLALLLLAPTPALSAGASDEPPAKRARPSPALLERTGARPAQAGEARAAAAARAGIFLRLALASSAHAAEAIARMCAAPADASAGPRAADASQRAAAVVRAARPAVAPTASTA
jgi:hypothetical protein